MGFYNVVNAASMQSGQPEDVSQILANFNAIAAVLNGGIDSSNITDGSIVGTDIANSTIPFSKLTAPAFTGYVPVWASSGTQPVLGNGVINGRYYQIGKLVVAKVDLTIGSTTTFGTGTYTFSLPIVGRSTSNEFGSGLAFDSSSGQFFFLTFRLTTTSTVDAYTGQAPANQWGAASPFVPAVNDLIAFSMPYEAA